MRTSVRPWYEAGLEIEPANESLVSGLSDVQAAAARANKPAGGAGGMGGMDGIGSMLSSPELYGRSLHSSTPQLNLSRSWIQKLSMHTPLYPLTPPKLPLNAPPIPHKVLKLN
jgi:hypothetical protein